VKNFLVAMRSLVGILPEVTSICYVGSRASARSGIWHPFFLHYLDMAAWKGTVNFYDPHEVSAVMQTSGVSARWECSDYKSMGKGYDLVIDDAHDGRSVQQAYSMAKFASYKVPAAQKGDVSYLGNAITIDPLNAEARAFPRAMIQSENQYPGSDRCAVCRYIVSIADGLGLAESYGFIRTVVTKLGLKPCSSYHGAQDLEYYSSVYKQLVRRGVVPLQDIYMGQDENTITRVLPMLTQDGVAQWNGTGFTLVNGGVKSRIVVRLPRVYGEQETLEAWTRQYGGSKYHKGMIPDIEEAQQPVSWVSSMDSASINIAYCPPTLMPMVMCAVLNSHKTPREKLILGLRVLEVSKQIESPLSLFLLDKEVFHRGVSPADYPCAPGVGAKRVFLTVLSGRPNYCPDFIISKAKIPYPDYLWRFDKTDHMGMRWRVYEYCSDEDGPRYRICAYIPSDSTSYMMTEGAQAYHSNRVEPPPCSFWSGPRLRIASFKDVEAFNDWVYGWGKTLSCFTLVPRISLIPYFTDAVQYYEVGEKGFFLED